MAPAKKSKTGSRRVAPVDGVSPSKDVRVSKKPKQKKRKLADMLGPQWSKRELERFYEGFRKYGHDWKKIANIVHNRSAEMVEALYLMNQAYLSLPEGTASVVGLIAMMTDHYSVLGGSGSEKDSDGCPEVSPDSQKHLKGSIHFGFSKEHLVRAQSMGSSDSCMSSLKRMRGCNGMQLYIPVKKRTPRVAVPALERRDDTVNYSFPVEKARRLKLNMNGDEFAHGDALVLAEAQRKAGSPKASPPCDRVAEGIKHSKVSKGKKMLSRSSMVQAKNIKTGMDNAVAEASLDSNGAENVDIVGDSGKSHFVDNKRGKKEKKGTTENDRKSDGIPQEYNGARGRLIGTPGRKSGIEAAKFKIHSSPHHASKKENKELFTEDESLAFDALQTLADLSLAMPSTTEPVESSRESANGGDITVDSSALSDAKLVNENADRILKKKKKRKTQASKTLQMQKAESQIESQSGKPVKNEPLVEEDIKAGHIVKEPKQISTPTKQCKSARSSDVTSINDQQMAEADVAVSSSQVQSTELVMPQTKRKSRRKREWSLISNDKQIPPSISSDLYSKSSSLLQGTTPYLKEKLCCLSSYLVRRWCGYEWFYSAIDYPWFAKKEFVEYLNHVGLGHIPRLTRVEWGVIRSSLGKPRRFSERFLHEEGVKLQQYRDSVRAHYDQLRAGLRGLPTDLAWPLSVGQRVIAIHPKTREFHDGSILTVDYDKCRVQFDRPELGVEFVMDINCMPSNLLENMPEALRRQMIPCEYGNLRAQNMNGQTKFPLSQYMGNPHAWIYVPSSTQSVADQTKVDLVTIGSHSKAGASRYYSMIPSTMQIESCSVVQVPPREGNIQLHALHPSHFLDRKEVPPFPSHLDPRRFYPGNILNCPQSTASSAEVNEILHHSGECEETRSKVAEILKGSRMNAHKMVDAAVQAISSIKEGENAYSKIGEALDSIGKIRFPPKPMFSSTSQCRANESLVDQNLANAQSAEKSQMTNNASNGESDAMDVQLPTELITSCVATLLMIQSCTERQHPPAEVARILDSAVTSLHPCCPQNLSVYREIQMCMGRIKTQILALIPS